MDIFDRIAAAIGLILAGAKHDAEELLEHIGAIDSHLADDDTHNAAVDANLTENEAVPDDQGHVAVVSNGLQKIIGATQTAVSSDTPEETAASGIAATSDNTTTDTGNADITSIGTPAATPPAGGDTVVADTSAPAVTAPAPNNDVPETSAAPSA